uniref:Uncharacterized protein n=1 Tax=Anguilla anguilla TaxID=7936 RepID=A0A0E9T236_ANGAN
MWCATAEHFGNSTVEVYVL